MKYSLWCSLIYKSVYDIVGQLMKLYLWWFIFQTSTFSVNLEHNNLTSFSGLVYLVNLRVLCLNHNHIECIVPRPKQPSQGAKSRVNLPAPQLSSVFAPEALTPLLENLEVLHLG